MLDLVFFSDVVGIRCMVAERLLCLVMLVMYVFCSMLGCLYTHLGSVEYSFEYCV